jgi:predicted nucleic acid-binding protein
MRRIALFIQAMMRMSTHPAIFARPLTHDETLRNVRALLNLPHCRAIGEEDGYWDTYRRVTAEVPTRGNLVPDAQLASILVGHGVTVIYTHDRDFWKFPFLDVRDPLD